MRNEADISRDPKFEIGLFNRNKLNIKLSKRIYYSATEKEEKGSMNCVDLKLISRMGKNIIDDLMSHRPFPSFSPFNRPF